MTTKTVTLTSDAYTQLNTVTDAYVVQNVSPYSIAIVLSDTQPAPDSTARIYLNPMDAITGADMPGTAWGIAIGGPGSSTVTVAE